MKKFITGPLYIFLWITFWAIWMTGCMPVRVTTEKLTDKSFKDYSSFNFISADDMHFERISYSRENYELLLEEINKLMLAKGYILSGTPDLLLNIGLVLEPVDKRSDGYPGNNMNYTGRRTYHFEEDEEVVEFYDEGAITIDFVDASTNKLIWQGTGVGMVTQNINKLQKRLTYAVEKIIGKLPPR